MFTGLVECTGSVVEFSDTSEGRIFKIHAPEIAGELTPGESVAVNGCCLTVTAFDPEIVQFDLLRETLDRTNLGSLTSGSRVNLERALASGARLGGHFVQGHIDTTTRLLAVESAGSDLGLTFQIPDAAAAYFIPKGSIAINGVSLTVADLLETSFRVWIIPHTRTLTNLGDLREGDAVNLEYDMIAKYIVRIASLGGVPSQSDFA